jgi:4,5-dihydroxyphthalate decarboxylase
MVWRTLLGEYPATRALRQGRIESPLLRLELADVSTPNKAFRRVVRDLEFDVAELALMTFLMARSRGAPLRLLPVVLFSRNPLRYLVCRADRRGDLCDLSARRIGARAYTTTTAAWARTLLADEFGVDLDRLQWLTYEEAHVAGVQDPPNVRRDPAHADLTAMLLDGTIDLAIVDPVPHDPRFANAVADADTSWRAWRGKTGAQTLNHVVVVRESLSQDAVCMTELIRMFADSSRMADTDDSPDSFFIGLDSIRRSLEVAISEAWRQHLLARPLTLSDLLIGQTT